MSQARFAAWYELFPRSTGGWNTEGEPVHGTFATATKALRLEYDDVPDRVVEIPAPDAPGWQPAQACCWA